MRAGYVFSEVLTGLRRNITMTIAMIFTTAISLGLLGGGPDHRPADQATQVLYGDKVEVIIYLTTDQSSKDPDCRDSVCQAHQDRRCEATARSRLSTYQTPGGRVTSSTSSSFAGQPEMLAIVQQRPCRASFHVKLHDPQRFKVISQQFSGQARGGVR